MQRHHLTQAKRIVVKIGTHTLANQNGKPVFARVANLVREMAELQQQGREVILVTSGAIAVGLHTLGMKRSPLTPLDELQMAAAIGQARLMELYQKHFARKHCLISQVLLTYDDLRNQNRRQNAYNTLTKLLQYKVIPIINENDVVSVDEIRVGDNDVLSSLVATLIQADVLILLTTPDGFYQIDGAGKQQRVPYIPSIDDGVLQHANGKSSAFSIGGMASKLKAAQTAVSAGANVVIACGMQKNIISRVLKGEDTGTLIGQVNSIKNLPYQQPQWEQELA